MLEFISFSSGSCGNCYYIGDRKRGLIIDAGIRAQSKGEPGEIAGLRDYLFRYGLTQESFQAILITHNHFDHIRGLKSFCHKKKGFFKPVYAPSGLISFFYTPSSVSYQNYRNYFKTLNQSGVTEIGDFKVRWFEVPHDALMTVGYQIELDGEMFFIMTDAGRVTDEAVEMARECSSIVIESNYDLDMLLYGPYDQMLKDRIRNGHGHLSNDECADALRRIWHPGLRNIFLCHRSDNNNTDELAVGCSRRTLEEIGAFGQEPDLRLVCLNRQTPTGPFTL